MQYCITYQGFLTLWGLMNQRRSISLADAGPVCELTTPVDDRWIGRPCGRSADWPKLVRLYYGQSTTGT